MNQELIMRISKNKVEPEWLLKYRLECFDKFKKAKSESFRYGLHIMLNFGLDLKDLKIKEKKYDKSDELEDFKDKIGTLIEKNEFYYLNMAFANIKIIHVKKNEERKIFLRNKDQFRYTMIIAEADSKVKIIETLEDNGEEYRSSYVEIFTDPGAEVDFSSAQNLDQNTRNVSGKYASIKEGSKVNWYDISIGCKFFKVDIVNLLEGEKAEGSNYGLFIGDGQQQFDIYSASIHKAENTKSNILVKGALKDKSKSLFRGLVKIEANAKNSNGYQKEEVILIDEEVEANAIPKLEINNEDVKCSHGASIGNVDREKIFYLMSRGISERKAVELILEGFFDVIIEKTENDKIREMVMGKLR